MHGPMNVKIEQLVCTLRIVNLKTDQIHKKILQCLDFFLGGGQQLQSFSLGTGEVKQNYIIQNSAMYVTRSLKGLDLTPLLLR